MFKLVERLTLSRAPEETLHPYKSLYQMINVPSSVSCCVGAYVAHRSRT